MAISKEDLIEAIAAGCGCNKSAAERGLNQLIKTIAEGIADGGEVVLRGIGSFTRERTEARQGRNPRTGEKIEIAAGYRVKFKAGKALKDQLAAA